MKQREGRALRVALWVGTVYAILGIVDDFGLHRQDFRDIYYSYFRIGPAAFGRQVLWAYVGMPVVLAMVCGGFVWLWDRLFAKPCAKDTKTREPPTDARH